MELFHLAINEKVAFVPGDPFYVDGRSSNAMRLNFSCVDEDTIEEGMRRLGAAAFRLLESRSGGKASPS
jgi:2-aminoadipate transaminase